MIRSGSRLLVLSLVALVLSCELAVTDGGPLAIPDPHSWLLEVPVGHEFTDGLEVLRFDTPEKVTIVDVRPVFHEGRLEYLGAFLAGDERQQGAIQYFPEFPPDDSALGELFPIPHEEGISSPRDAGWELLMGYRVVDGGLAVRSGVEITYEVGRRRYRDFIPAELVVCPPGSVETCEFQDTWEE